MKWYLAKIIFRIICGEGNHTAQFDEQLRLIKADDDFHAFQKARLLDEHEEDNFLNAAQKPVHWKFIDVSEIHAHDFLDGAEMYSRIREEDDADVYIRTTHLRAAHLLENCMNINTALN